MKESEIHNLRYPVGEYSPKKDITAGDVARYIKTSEDFPDKVSGRCDNCGNTIFKSSVKDFVFLRECRQCGMKKSI